LAHRRLAEGGRDVAGRSELRQLLAATDAIEAWIEVRLRVERLEAAFWE
jgi:hypothetical protein